MRLFHMDMQRADSLISFPAFVTFIRSGLAIYSLLLIGMSSVMIFEMAVRHEPLVTFRALMGLLATVDPHMSFQIPALGEALPAFRLCANIRLLASLRE